MSIGRGLFAFLDSGYAAPRSYPSRYEEVFGLSWKVNSAQCLVRPNFSTNQIKVKNSHYQLVSFLRARSSTATIDLLLRSDWSIALSGALMIGYFTFFFYH